MKIAKLLDGLRSDQRRVPRKHDDLVIGRQSLLCDHERVSRSALLFLQDKVDSSVTDGLTNPIGFMADNGVYILRRNHFRSRSDHMRQQRPSADLMQNFRMFGFQACPFARCHNCDGNTRDAR